MVSLSKLTQDQQSIRRKTCETMTLLYEAALKTNPEVEEPKDRPAAINPTAGVLPRSSVGRIVWVKDEARPGGGIWIAETEEDRISGGVSPIDCILASDLEPGSLYARQWAIAKGQGIGQAIVPKSSTDTPPLSIVQEVNQARTMLDPPSQTLSEVSQPGGIQAQVFLGDQSVHSNGAGEVFSDVQTAPNVNPQIKFDGLFPQDSMVVTGSGSEITTVSGGHV